MSATRNAPATGARVIVVADDCTDLIYVNGLYYFDLTMSIPVDLTGKIESRVSGSVRLTPNGLWRFQNKLLNAKPRKRLDG